MVAESAGFYKSEMAEGAERILRPNAADSARSALAAMVAEDIRTAVGDPGRPLDAATRAAMEQRFAWDFGAVRIHAGEAAARSARGLGAAAYTVGSQIVLGVGNPVFSSPDGRRLLAHELAHVVQQRSGPVDGTPAAGGVKISDPSDRFERQAEETAEDVMNAPVQRQEEEQEEEVSE